MSYVKIRVGDLVHFIRSDIVGDIDFGSSHRAMCSSEFVVDTRKNEIVKCRFPIEDVVSYGVLNMQQPQPEPPIPFGTSKAQAWMSVVAVLTEVMPNWLSMGNSGASAAVNAIKHLKTNSH